MSEYIERWLRDGTEISKSAWHRLIQEDINVENSESTWDITATVNTDIGNGREIELNGHLYQTKTDMLYDTAKELFDELYVCGDYDIIIEILQQLSEEELAAFFTKSERIAVVNGKFVYKDLE